MNRLIETDYFAAQERERLDEIEAERSEKYNRFVGRADEITARHGVTCRSATGSANQSRQVVSEQRAPR